MGIVINFRCEGCDEYLGDCTCPPEPQKGRQLQNDSYKELMEKSNEIAKKLKLKKIW